ncbi:type II toxin-antitoxin system Phd/YefM family antitoxin [Patescibacteria group bacterium]|nr:type II toxin-antitoxin system Phd/YefM family antitoxin [Patescibacteria group bacterium]MCG2702045.1 type II toxin-antitoxin system Phd/YefM family antitoxin [Candidatus Parcubacteria bacterium]MBU4265564.1 type II toxin-antitoxin system Phd/YefM family antitoxin [Patescibacteria group bacterium]MBU4389893.1 type II toxin-antitoxin system Phd/YefM family antitoxin [Patescibacteria group bacterium]MBU4397234.1 type II toxin-antitoxin system Phd/YefM family antitoxin [Patescibacteria group b
MLVPTKQNISTVTDLRVNTIALLDEVEKKGMKYVFQRSVPKAVLLSMDRYKKLLEMLEDWEDEFLARKLEKEDKGNGVSLKAVMEEYGIKA